MKKTILLVGGTGHFGRPVAEQLHKDDYVVRIFSRDVDRARNKMGEAFEYIDGDVRETERLVEASRGCWALHVNLNSSVPRELKEIEYVGTLNCVKAAKQNQLSRISIISCANVRKENTWSTPVRYKWHTEQLIRNSGIPYTIFAPTYFMNGLPAYIKGDRAMIIGKQIHLIRWLSVKDYAVLVSKALASQKAVNKKFPIYGPTAHSLEEALQLYCKKKCQGVSLFKTSLNSFIFMASVSLNPKLRYVALCMKALNRIDDSGDMSETALILGKPSVGLKEWVETLP